MQPGGKHFSKAVASRPGRGSSSLARLRRRAPELFALSGVAIAQPLLDVFGQNPEFFVDGRYSSSQIIGFALVITLLPATVALAVAALAELAHPRVGEGVHSLLIGVFAVLFGAVLLRTLDLDGLWLVGAGALALAGLVVWFERRSERMRSFLSWVALGNLVFLGTFLFTSPTAELVGDRAGAADLGSVRLPALAGPVVLVVLDELPVTTLMDPDGTINEQRFPNFARLAARSTWFRNASSPIPMTHQAMPALLTGLEHLDDNLPTHHDYPRNFFTLFGDRYPMHRYETVTDMCPPAVCTPPPQRSLRAALDDASVVYGHKALPTSLSDELPAIDQAWGAFGQSFGPPPREEDDDSFVTEEDAYGQWHNMALEDRLAPTQLEVLRRMVNRISAEPAVHMVHVAVPHAPWVLAPSGQTLTQSYRNELDADDPAFERTAVHAYQLHSLQVGAADRVVGQLIERLEKVGAWDEALVVVTSDHGVSLLPPDLGRTLTARNEEELLRMPLFIKAPGQAQGAVRDDVAQLYDVVPSIVDLLGIETDWEFDGHSLYDGSRRRIQPRVDRDIDAALDVVARHAEDLPHGRDWVGLAAVGEHGDLVGSTVEQHILASPSPLRWALDDQDVLGSLPTDDNELPLYLVGTVSGGDGPPPDLLVAVNGRFAGVTGAYRPDGDGWRFSGVLAPLFRPGPNEVTAYEVERTFGSGVVLHPVGPMDLSQ